MLLTQPSNQERAEKSVLFGKRYLNDVAKLGFELVWGGGYGEQLLGPVYQRYTSPVAIVLAAGHFDGDMKAQGLSGGIQT